MSALQQILAASGGGEAPWWFVANGIVSHFANPLTPGLPSGWAIGDLLVCVVVSKSGGTATTPSGWTADVLNDGTWVLSVFHKFAQSGETAPSITVSNANFSGRMCAYRNISALGTVGTVSSNASSDTSTTDSITTTTDGELVISVYATGTNRSPASYPSGTTTRFTFGGGTSAAVVLVDETKTAAGATTQRTLTWDAAVAVQAVALSFKL